MFTSALEAFSDPRGSVKAMPYFWGIMAMPRFRHRFARLNSWISPLPPFKLRPLVKLVPDLANIAEPQSLPVMGVVKLLHVAGPIQVLAADLFGQHLAAEDLAQAGAPHAPSHPHE